MHQFAQVIRSRHSPYDSEPTPVLLSERLGYISIAVTIDRYSHVILSIDRHAADVVAQLILPRRG